MMNIKSLAVLTISIILLGIMLGCAQNTSRQVDDPTDISLLVWPAPPEQARIRYVFSFYEPVDLGIKPGLMKRFIAAFAGNDSQRMTRPHAVAVDAELIAVADPGLGVIHLYLTQTEKYMAIEEIEGQRLASPIGVSLGNDVIYISDSILGKVFVLGRDGVHRQTIANLDRPTGIVFHPANRRLYVADTMAHQVVVFDEAGVEVQRVGTRGAGAGEFNFPTSLAASGNVIYVNDTMNFRVQSLDLEGNSLGVFGQQGDGSGQFAHSKGISVDAQGHVYIADALSNHIQMFDPDGRFLMAFGGMGNRKGQFTLPAGISIFGNRIFIADSQNQRIQVFEFIEESS